MIKTLEDGDTLVIEADDPRLSQEELDIAVNAAMQQAKKGGRCGILVTRTGYTTFSVALSAQVPYGQTVEVIAPTWD